MSFHLSRDQVREIDRRAIAELGISGLMLMENAGRGCVQTLLTAGCHGPVVICCGKGNNGGDGFVIARQLDEAGVHATILLLADPSELRGDARANYEIAIKCRLSIVVVPADASAADFARWFAGAEWIVDALLGTGAKGDPQPLYSLAIDVANDTKAKKLAVDLPSGLDCDLGTPGGPTLRAGVTCTFVAPKNGFQNPVAQPYLGRVQVVPIGVPRWLIDSAAKRQP
jgi:NAD(P)H-hydrate epimerase